MLKSSRSQCVPGAWRARSRSHSRSSGRAMSPSSPSGSGWSGSASMPIVSSSLGAGDRAGPVAVAVGDAADDPRPARAARPSAPAGSPAAAAPSCASASRAQARAVVNSRRRFSTARPTTASSSGKQVGVEVLAGRAAPWRRPAGSAQAWEASGRIRRGAYWRGCGGDARADSPAKPPRSARRRARSCAGCAGARRPRRRRGSGDASRRCAPSRTTGRTPGGAARGSARRAAGSG